MATIMVFKLDGSLQCGMGQEISLDEMGEKLKAIGGEISHQEKRRVPYMMPAVCGAPTGTANVYTITSESWERIKTGIVGTLGFAIWVFDTPTTLVYKYDGTLQCGMGKEITLEEMAKELKEAGIEVHRQYKGNDGALRIALCGAGTGQMNVYEIGSGDLTKAQDLGFSYLMNKGVVSAMSPVDGHPYPLAGDPTAEMALMGKDEGFPWPWASSGGGPHDGPFPW